MLILVTVAGATAHAQQQQSAIETLGKTMSDLAKEGYEIKAAEDLSGGLPKFVLQKAESIVICQINPPIETKAAFNLDRGEGDGRKAAKRRAWSSIEDRPFSVASGPVDARASRS